MTKSSEVIELDTNSSVKDLVIGRRYYIDEIWNITGWYFYLSDIDDYNDGIHLGTGVLDSICSTLDQTYIPREDTMLINTFDEGEDFFC